MSDEPTPTPQPSKPVADWKAVAVLAVMLITLVNSFLPKDHSLTPEQLQQVSAIASKVAEVAPTFMAQKPAPTATKPAVKPQTVKAPPLVPKRDPISGPSITLTCDVPTLKAMPGEAVDFDATIIGASANAVVQWSSDGPLVRRFEGGKSAMVKAPASGRFTVTFALHDVVVSGSGSSQVITPVGDAKSITVDVLNGPQPPPVPPGPTPEPTPPVVQSPITEAGLHVLVVEETDDRDQLPEATIHALRDTAAGSFRDYAAKHCVPNGAFVIDKDDDVSQMPAWVQSVRRRPLGKLPWLMAGTPTSFYEGQITTPEDGIAAVQRAEGR